MPSEFEEREGNGINEKEEKINIKKEKKLFKYHDKCEYTNIYIYILHLSYSAQLLVYCS